MLDFLRHLQGEYFYGFKAIYTASLGIGLILPLLNILLGSLFEGLDLDFDLELDGDSIHTLLPLNPLSLLAFLLFFGGMGLYLSNMVSQTGGFILSLLTGCLVAFLFNKYVVQNLKNQQIQALELKDLIGETCKISVRVKRAGVGAVMIVADNRVITYSAELSDEETRDMLEIDSLVMIVDVDEEKDLVKIKGVEQSSSHVN